MKLSIVLLLFVLAGVRGYGMEHPTTEAIEILSPFTNKMLTDVELTKLNSNVVFKNEEATLSSRVKKGTKASKKTKSKKTTIKSSKKISIKKQSSRKRKTRSVVITPLTIFEKNKGNLPWPVNSRIIAMKFGRQKPYPNSEIIFDNHGIDIEVKAGSDVTAVFDGEVTAVTEIGPAFAVIVKHGKYYTTYSNLETTNVAVGQQIKAKQLIGSVIEKEEGNGELEFIICNENMKNFDPEKWLK